MIPFPEDLDTSFKGIVDRIMASLAESGLITDSVAGSVTLTLVESFAREMATFYSVLERAHSAGYLDTAQDKALDNVVAVLGIRRAQAGRLKGRVEFSRSTPAPEDISIPAGLRVTGPDLPDGTLMPVLETVEETRIDRGEFRAVSEVQEVPGSDTGSWPTLSPGVLSIMPRPVLGVESVTNPDPIRRDSQDEDDESLRGRARAALREGQRGTAEAIEAAVRERGVENVQVYEPESGPPGIVLVRVGDPEFEQDPDRLWSVREAVQEAKASGVRVTLQYLRTVYFDVTLEIEPEDPEMADDAFNRLSDGIRQTIAGFVNGLGPGGQVSHRKLEAVVLGNPAVRDVGLSVRSFTLRYPPSGSNGVPTPDVDTGRRELPGGDWYIANLEKAAVDLVRWPPQISRRLVKSARIDLSVSVVATALPLETLQDNIRAAVDAHVARIQPEEVTVGDDTQTVRRLSFNNLAEYLEENAFVSEINSAEVVHRWSGLAEALTSEHDVLLEEGERLAAERIDVNIGSAS